PPPRRRPRLPSHGKGGRGRRPDPGDLRQGVPVARPLPRRRRVVHGLAEGGGPQPGHRPVSPATAGEDAPRGGSRDRGRRGFDRRGSAARDRARGAPAARPSRAARAAPPPAPPAPPLRTPRP